MGARGSPGAAGRLRGVLFLCVANSSRSQIAEGLARSLLPGDVEVHSAGSSPTELHSLARQVMAEIGIDLSSRRAKHWSEIPLDRVDLIITLCAEEACPVVPGAIGRLHWGLPDPAAVQGSEEERLGAFRATREELRRRLAGLSRSL